jgi:hypothetical protein
MSVFKSQVIFTLCLIVMLALGITSFAKSEVNDNTGATVDEPLAPESVQTHHVEPVRQPASESGNIHESYEDEGETAVQTPAAQPGKVGPGEAEKYFRKKNGSGARGAEGGSKRAPTAAAQGQPVGPEDHYLAVGVGGTLSSDSYQWGQTPHTTNTGRLVASLTYRIAPLSALADWALRADLMSYELPEARATQLAVSPVLMFPDSGSKFPLYFGIGVGPGIFIQQVPQESFLALEYQIFAGVRVFNVIESTGFFIETGLKDHVLLLSDGQYNGVFLTAGAVFTF